MVAADESPEIPPADHDILVAGPARPDLRPNSGSCAFVLAGVARAGYDTLQGPAAMARTETLVDFI
jgi:hypothetical protein